MLQAVNLAKQGPSAVLGLEPVSLGSSRLCQDGGTPVLISTSFPSCCSQCCSHWESRPPFCNHCFVWVAGQTCPAPTHTAGWPDSGLWTRSPGQAPSQLRAKQSCSRHQGPRAPTHLLQFHLAGFPDPHSLLLPCWVCPAPFTFPSVLGHLYEPTAGSGPL